MNTLILLLTLMLFAPAFGQSKKPKATTQTAKAIESPKPGWQYAKWGMTADEIIAASGGTARILLAEEKRAASGPDYTALVKDEYSSGPFNFKVTFRAEKNEATLSSVHLLLKDPAKFVELKTAMISKYGQGDSSDSSKSGDVVRWMSMEHVITLSRTQGIDVAKVTFVDVVFLTYKERPQNAGL